MTKIELLSKYDVSHGQFTINNKEEMLISFPKGSYAGNTNIKGGCSFYYSVKPQEKMSVEFSVFFPLDFNPASGLKFGVGLASAKGVNGGNWSDSGDFSIRFHARKENDKGEIDAEAYCYLSRNQAVETEFISTGKGYSLGRSKFSFKRGMWHKVKLFVRLNSPNKYDGIIKIYKGGEVVYDCKTINFRDNYPTKINYVYSASFFGGSASYFASPSDQYLKLRKIRYITY